ncbi:MAG: hypothetical protein ACRDRV_20635 [Pseudonocardiaceae bacterium]
MMSAINAVTEKISALLPEITLGLRFGTALIGFALAAHSATKHLRNWRWRRGEIGAQTGKALGSPNQ